MGKGTLLRNGRNGKNGKTTIQMFLLPKTILQHTLFEMARKIFLRRINSRTNETNEEAKITRPTGKTQM